MPFEYDEDRANEEFVRIARKYNLNPVILREIMILRNKGMNNAYIAQHLGINRNTVNKYVNALNEMKNEDLMNLLGLIAILGGAYLFVKILQSLGGNNE